MVTYAREKKILNWFGRLVVRDSVDNGTEPLYSRSPT